MTMLATFFWLTIVIGGLAAVLLVYGAVMRELGYTEGYKDGAAGRKNVR